MIRTPRINKSELAFGIRPKTPDPVRGMSEAHLKYIRKLPCVVTRFGPCDPHHLTRVPRGRRGTGMKNLDIYTIPLTRHVHDALHADNNEVDFLMDKAAINDAPRYALKLALQSPDKDIRDYAKELLKAGKETVT